MLLLFNYEMFTEVTNIIILRVEIAKLFNHLIDKGSTQIIHLLRYIEKTPMGRIVTLNDFMY